MEKESSSSVKSNKFIQMTQTFLLSECCSNAARLFLRLFVGILMLTHGIAKIENFDTLVDTFPRSDRFGNVDFAFDHFSAKSGASILVMVGFLTRLALIPLIFSMIVAAFLTFPTFALATSELPLMYFSGNFYNAFISRSGKMFDRLSLGQGL